MDIPALQENGELPPGEHPATVDDVEAVYREGEPKGIIVIRLGDSE